MALAHFQATQRRRAIVWLNGRGELQYRTVEYGHGAQKKLYPDNRGEKSGECELSLAGQHWHNTLIWWENGEIKKKTRLQQKTKQFSKQ